MDTLKLFDRTIRKINSITEVRYSIVLVIAKPLEDKRC